jgi:hypothetical protein
VWLSWPNDILQIVADVFDFKLILQESRSTGHVRGLSQQSDMSGVEVASFVLAAFPLMISALEHYRKSAEVLEGWWKIKREYRKCKDNLNYHKVVFEENLEELLLPLIVDKDKLQRLLDDPGGPEWKDPELEKMLKERMPKTYSS